MVIDLDYHQGNANTLYFKSDENVFTFSMHADSWIDIDIENNLDILVPAKCDDKEYLEILNANLHPAIEKFKPELVFYIAGSDAYHKDTLAGMNLTRQGMLERNKCVYDLVTSSRIPLVVLAGGGYGPESWEVYYDFVKYGLTRTVGLNGC
jgi:acetoin utilization deacetylase AcuC-like enzyme